MQLIHPVQHIRLTHISKIDEHQAPSHHANQLVGEPKTYATLQDTGITRDDYQQFCR